ncbi:hypothetical protein ACFE04_027701 [Oxalis oulophora]
MMKIISFQDIVSKRTNFKYEKLANDEEKVARLRLRRRYWVVKKKNGKSRGVKLWRSRKLILKAFSLVVFQSRVAKLYAEIVDRIMKIDGNIVLSTWGLPVLSHSHHNHRHRHPSLTGDDHRRIDGVVKNNSCFCFIMQNQNFKSSSSSSQSPDCNDSKFTFDMLKALVESNDFYAKECSYSVLPMAYVSVIEDEIVVATDTYLLAIRF